MFNYINGITNHSGVELHLMSQSKSEHVPLHLVDQPSSLEVGSGKGEALLCGSELGRGWYVGRAFWGASWVRSTPFLPARGELLFLLRQFTADSSLTLGSVAPAPVHGGARAGRWPSAEAPVGGRADLTQAEAGRPPPARPPSAWLRHCC